MAVDEHVERIRQEVAERGIEFFFAQFVDLHARPSAKLIPAAHLDDLVNDGAGFAGFAAGDIGQVPSDPDIAAIPDLGSFTPVPWEPIVARFACDVTVEGEPWPYDPRTILRNQLARARDAGFELKIGLELEYFLLRRGDDGRIELADPLDDLEKPCYDLRGLTRNYEFLTTISRYVNELGWGNYANDHEDANGQFEQNFTYDDALVSCDRAIFFRYMVHTLAQQQGLLATFMPKPFTHLTGNGCHFHMSLWRDGENLFLDEDDPRGLGLSETAYQFIGGLKAARARVLGDHGADGQLVQAAQARLHLVGRDLVSRLDLVRLQQPHPDAPHPGAGADRGSDDRRVVQPVPRRDRGARVRARRDRAQARPRRAEHREPLRGADTTSSALGGSRRCPPPSSRRSASSRATTYCGRRSDVVATRTSWTGSSASSATSGTATTSR